MNQSKIALWSDSVLLLLLGCGSLTVMAGAVLAPILPSLAVALQIPPELAGNLVSAHFLTLAICSPILGPLADRYGQVRLLIPALLLYGLTGMAGAILPTFRHLLISRWMLGAATAGVAAAGLGLLSSRYDGEARNQAIAYVAMVITLANVFYPLMAGGLGFFHWRWAFLLYGVSILFAGAALVLLRRPTSIAATDALGAVSPLSILRQPLCVRVLVSLTTNSAIVYGTVIYLPLYLSSTFQTSTLFNGMMLAVQAVGAAVSSGWLMTRLSRRFGPMMVMGCGLGLMAIMLCCFPNLSTVSVLIWISVVFGLSFGVVTPGLYTALANATPPQLQSSVLASGIGAGFLGQFLAPLVLAPIFQVGKFAGVFYALASLALLTGLGLVVPISRPASSLSTPRQQ